MELGFADIHLGSQPRQVRAICIRLHIAQPNGSALALQIPQQSFKDGVSEGPNS
jgi:hypothetical protein